MSTLYSRVIFFFFYDKERTMTADKRIVPVKEKKKEKKSSIIYKSCLVYFCIRNVLDFSNISCEFFFIIFII